MTRPPPPPSRTRERQAHTAALLRDSGLDICHWFSHSDAHADAEVARDVPARMPSADELGLLIGNTRALWAPFQEWLKDYTRGTAPLDEYVEQTVSHALADWNIRWLTFSHGAGALPIQKYSEAARLARLGPAGLCIHPLFGPWIALRAVAIVESEQAAESPELSPLTLQHPCSGCHAPCLQALETALASKDDSLRRFLPVRDVCPVGSTERYSDAQIDFHYNRRLR